MSNPDLNVALVSEEFPPFMFGGIASVCHDLAYSLSKKGVTTRVLAGRARSARVQVVNDFLKVVRLPCLDLPPRFVWFQLQNYRAITRFVKESTIIHAVNPQVSSICVLLKRKLGRRLVSSIHGTPPQELRTFMKSPFSEWTIGDFAFNLIEHPLNDFATRTSLTNSDRVITCSNTTRREILVNYPAVRGKMISVIPNAVSMDKIASIAENNDSAETNGVLIIYFGRLYWRKGITYLVRAMDHLARRTRDVFLDIFGKGPMENEIRHLVSSLHLEDRVRLRGHVPYTRLLNRIKKADVVVIPSLYEAQPVSALEAMACEKPVVAFDLGFMREIIRDGYNGLLARPHDERDLSEKMEMLANDRKLRTRLGRNSYGYVKVNHNWDTIVDRYIEQYRAVLESC